MELPDGKVTRLDNVRSVQVPEEGPAWLAYLRGPVPQPPATQTPGAPPPPPTPGELVLRHLADGKERTFADATEYQLSRDGRTLVFAVAGKKEEANGVYALTPGQDYPPLALVVGAGKYSRLTWDDKQRQLVFLHSLTPKQAGARPEVRLYHWRRPLTGLVALPPDALRRLLPSLALSYARLPLAGAVSPAPLAGLSTLMTLPIPRTTARLAAELACNGKPGLKPGHRLSDQDAPGFSLDGSRVYFGVSPPPPPAAPAGPEKAVVELWHFRDDYIQPMQRARYRGVRTFRAVYRLGDGNCRQLADETLPTVVAPPVGDWGLGMDDRAYRHLLGAEENVTPFDAVLVNQRTGARRPMLKKQRSRLSFSPAGKYLLTFDGKDWHSLSVADGKKVNLTAKLGVRFDNELHDTPSTPPPYGHGGWTKDDRHVLLYDRYDIWLVAPDGSSVKNLTAGLGRKSATQLRIVQLDPRQRSIDSEQPLLLRAENERTRDTGFYRVRVGGGTPTLLIMGARNYSPPVKARKGERYLLTLSTFADYPDLYVADPDFREVRRVSDAGRQKDGLLWGKAELVRYRSLDGTPLQAVLVRPENFDPKKKYPMIVYIYERLSQGLHRFHAPAPGTTINLTFYASNGYLVLLPDIAYTVGQPGQSALKCVLPAVQAVVDKGCVDEKAIGLHGHSWGGYQTAYLITQTTRFRAAAAGAPVCNMTSAYGGVRWGTGTPRQFQYEKTQSRIGGSLWQYPGRFVENSPLFHADRIKTPLLMLHNDRDEAVPWQQGIEYYLALRRLGKEAYLFNYPGEGHGLRQRVNQVDYTVRMQQFFDHHLKGATKPEWMARGIAYTPPATTERTRPRR
jgi:dipeptidyl aminopeptidase/acylaminoacyl peptidase